MCRTLCSGGFKSRTHVELKQAKTLEHLGAVTCSQLESLSAQISSFSYSLKSPSENIHKFMSYPFKSNEQHTPIARRPL